jgi:uncharacterized low-complexity protein
MKGRGGTQIAAASFDSRITIESRSSFMQSRFAVSALVVASLLGATAIASAQTQPAPGASSEGNVGPDATAPKMKSHNTKTTKMKTGTTTGMSSHTRHAAPHPAGQGNAGTGMDNNAK